MLVPFEEASYTDVMNKQLILKLVKQQGVKFYVLRNVNSNYCWVSLLDDNSLGRTYISKDIAIQNILAFGKDKEYALYVADSILDVAEIM